MLTQSQFSQIKFSAILNNHHRFYSVAKAINFNEQAATQITSDGIKFIVEDAKSFQATAYITKDCFSEYKLTTSQPRTQASNDEEAPDDTITFGLNLKMFTECLSMFINMEYNSSMRMMYKGEGAPVVVVLEHHGDDDLITEFSVKTNESWDILEFDIDADQTMSQVIIKGQEFYTLLNEINKDCEEIELFLSPNAPFFRLTTFGDLHAQSNIEITNSSDILITFSCTTASKFRYKFHHIKLMMKTLAISSKVAIRTSQDGLIGLQVMIENIENSNLFVEYFIMPTISTEDDIL